MSAAGWYVVKFVKEKNVIEVIPSNWIKSFEECFWPTKFGSIKLQSAIKTKLNPVSDWKLYPIKVICKHMFTTYCDASKFANKVLAKSSSESEDIVVKNISTKRKKQNKYDHGESSSDDGNEKQSEDEVLPFPKYRSKFCLTNTFIIIYL